MTRAIKLSVKCKQAESNTEEKLTIFLKPILFMKYVLGDDRGYLNIKAKSATFIKFYRIYCFVLFTSIVSALLYEIYLQKTLKYMVWSALCSVEMLNVTAILRKFNDNEILLNKFKEINEKLKTDREEDCLIIDRYRNIYLILFISITPLRVFLYYFHAAYHNSSVTFLLFSFFLLYTFDIEHMWRITISFKIYIYQVLLRRKLSRLKNTILIKVYIEKQWESVFRKSREDNLRMLSSVYSNTVDLLNIIGANRNASVNSLN